MKATFIALCTIPALLSTVSALKCTYCGVILIRDKSFTYNLDAEMSSKPYCDGHEYSCTTEDSACASIYVTSTKYDNAKESYFTRDCLKIQDCNVSETISSPGKKITYSTTCCHTDGCTPVQPVLKEENKTKNGVSCPACYSEEKECKPQYAMHCTGDEKSCLEFKRTAAFNLNPDYISGCSTKNVCKSDRGMDFLNRPKSLENHYCKKTDSDPDLKTGHFIWCNICHDYNVNRCEGAPFLCSPNEDVCVIERTRSIYDGRDEVEITRRCGKSHECNRVGSIRSSTKIILINTTCCDENICMPPAPTLPSMDDDTNGVICPACFVPNSDRCLGRSDLKCTGNEKRCLHYMRTEKQDMYTVTESLHGCTTDDICKAGSSMVLPNGHYYKTIKTDIYCNSAITLRSESYTSLMLIVTALIVFKVDI